MVTCSTLLESIDFNTKCASGWNFAQLTDVVVHRVRNGEPMTDERNTARLVYSDGCRNPAYRVLAPFNPWRDGSNGLINNFDFRVFMFQSMESGDAIMITAKVMACVEEEDCAPVRTRAREGLVSELVVREWTWSQNNFDMMFDLFMIDLVL